MVAPDLGSWTGTWPLKLSSVKNLFDETEVILRDDSAGVAGLVR